MARTLHEQIADYLVSDWEEIQYMRNIDITKRVISVLKLDNKQYGPGIGLIIQGIKAVHRSQR